jgi:MinD superfamily P-loop ATPase
VFLTDGIKGGVGKSFYTKCQLEYFIKKGWEYRLVEADYTIPDVERIYKKIVKRLRFLNTSAKSTSPKKNFEAAMKATTIVNFPPGSVSH